jgi:3-methyladenine DNA glycosylase AlkC
MAEPLKLMFDQTKISQLAEELANSSKQFDKKKFLRSFDTAAWNNAELKQRVTFIAEAIHELLPLDFPKSMAVLIPVSRKFSWGFFGVFFCEYVEKYGMDFWEESMHALEEFTKTSTAEFAIRKFIRKDPKHSMQQMVMWSKSENHHVRRLSSEGCRPRLPWGMKLDEFVKDPAPVLKILDRLKNDPELYVRKSVANNLNDISKDHPELVLEIAQQWAGKSSNTDWIIRHGLRTLLKGGNKKALSLFDHHDAAGLSVSELALDPKRIRIGEKLKFSFIITSEHTAKVPARVEFAIDYMKANGKPNRKVFHVSGTPLNAGTTAFKRQLSFADLTTRKHHPGRHVLYVFINGETLASAEFMLNS